MSDLDTETTGTGTTTFEHFGRKWTVPTTQHQAHIRAVKQIRRAGFNLDADDVAEIFLPADEYQELLAMEKPMDELTDFAAKISEAIGVGDSGNSKPSSTSS
jgi:hypothetical protein